MSEAMLPDEWAALIVLLGAIIGFAAPRWIVPLVLVLVPHQIRVFAAADLATLVLIGGAVGRSREIVGVAQREPLVPLALLGPPTWAMASASWARQAGFAPELAAKWATVGLAVLVTATLDRREARTVVAACLLAIASPALWAFGEHMQWIEPRGRARDLQLGLIDYAGVVRGRGLFHHPNKLAEFLEPGILLLVACAVGGVYRAAAIAVILIGFLGVWGTGSWGGLGVVVGGAILVTAATAMPRLARRAGLGLLAVAPVAAIAFGIYGFRAHGGFGPREAVYRFAIEKIAEHPLLGVGAGNWALAVGTADMTTRDRFWFRAHAHSLYLMVGAELGLVGLALVLGLFAVPLGIGARRLFGRDPEATTIGVGAAAGVLGFLAHALLNYPFRYPVNAIMPGLMLGLLLAAGRSDDSDGVAPAH